MLRARRMALGKDQLRDVCAEALVHATSPVVGRRSRVADVGERRQIPAARRPGIDNLQAQVDANSAHAVPTAHALGFADGQADGCVRGLCYAQGTRVRAPSRGVSGSALSVGPVCLSHGGAVVRATNRRRAALWPDRLVTFEAAAYGPGGRTVWALEALARDSTNGTRGEPSAITPLSCTDGMDGWMDACTLVQYSARCGA
jgi:hypothetical protein